MGKILVTKTTLPDYDKYCKLIKELWDSHWITNNGTFHQQLEKKLLEYCQCNNITLYTNGHLALENAIASLNLKGEVITTPFTFVSTTHAIVRNNLVPVFCDINYDDYTIDVNKIESLITDKTCAIIPVHVYGNICNVDEIAKLAKKYNLKVIYDAAHAFGESYKGKNIANYGDISMFSFHATKVFNTIEGGCLMYNHDEYKPLLEKFKNFGITDPDNIDYVGTNAKMNEFQAAMGILNLENLQDSIKKRKEIFTLYCQLLKDVKGIKLSKLNKNVEYNYSYFPIVITDEYGLNREELIEKLNSNGIYPRKYFYPITNEIACYRGKYRGDTPIAHDVSQRVLTLPLYPDLEKSTVKKICKIIKDNGGC